MAKKKKSHIEIIICISRTALWGFLPSSEWDRSQTPKTYLLRNKLCAWHVAGPRGYRGRGHGVLAFNLSLHVFRGPQMLVSIFWPLGSADILLVWALSVLPSLLEGCPWKQLPCFSLEKLSSYWLLVWFLPLVNENTEPIWHGIALDSKSCDP